MDTPTRRYASLVKQLGRERSETYGWKAEVATLLGVDASYISRVGKTRGVSVETIERAIRGLRLRREFFHDPAIPDDSDYREFLEEPGGGSTDSTSWRDLEAFAARAIEGASARSASKERAAIAKRLGEELIDAVMGHPAALVYEDVSALRSAIRENNTSEVLASMNNLRNALKHAREVDEESLYERAAEAKAEEHELALDHDRRR